MKIHTNFPYLEIRMYSFEGVPELFAVTHTKDERLLWRFGRFHQMKHNRSRPQFNWTRKGKRREDGGKTRDACEVKEGKMRAKAQRVREMKDGEKEAINKNHIFILMACPIAKFNYE